jgi:hypothetical protein
MHGNATPLLSAPCLGRTCCGRAGCDLADAKDHGAWLRAPTTLHTTIFRGPGGASFAAVKSKDTRLRVQRCIFNVVQHIYVPEKSKMAIYTDARGVSLKVAPGQGSLVDVYPLEQSSFPVPLPTDNAFVQLQQVRASLCMHGLWRSREVVL